MFNSSFSHPCTVIDELVDGILGVSADMLSDMEITVIPIPPITLEFVMRITYAVDVLTDVLNVVITDVVPTIDVDMLTDENAKGLLAVMIPSEFTLPSP